MELCLFAALIMNVKVLKAEYPELAIMFWPMGIAFLILSPFAFDVSPDIFYGNMKILAIFGIVSIGLGEIFTIIGLANIEAQTGSLLALVEPVSGVFFDRAVLGIALSYETLAGCTLIMLSAAFISFKDSERIKKNQKASFLRKFSGSSPGKFTVRSKHLLLSEALLYFQGGYGVQVRSQEPECQFRLQDRQWLQS